MEEPAFRESRIYKALGNPLRLRILYRLALAPATPTQLARELRRPLEAVSRNLTRLHDLNLVWFHPAPPCLIYRAKYDLVMPLLAAGADCARVARHDDPEGAKTPTATGSSAPCPPPPASDCPPTPPSGARPPG